MHERPTLIQSFLTLLLVAFVVTLLGSCDLNALLGTGSTKKTAIVYGINLYYPPNGTSSPNLNYCVPDAISMASLLSAQGWNVILRTDSNATTTNLQLDINTVAATAEAGQRVMFYYSGHGTVFPANSPYAGEWILPQDVLAAYPAWDYSKMINQSIMAAMFQPLSDRGANLVFILDSCNSGGFVFNGTYSSDLPDLYNTYHYNGGSTLQDSSMLFVSLADYFNNSNQSGALNQSNVWVFSAAGKMDNSQETSSLGHGVFTYALIHSTDMSNGFKAADYNKDGFITLQELYRFAKESLDKWNQTNYYYNQYLPHLSGNPLDILIFH